MVRWVFHRNGHQVGDYSDSWGTACKKAGVPGRLVHDLRRTAVRRLERAGVPRSVAMKLTGHKTENVYRRYAIVSESDLALGVAKVAALDGATAATGRLAASGEPRSNATSTVLTQFADSEAIAASRRASQRSAIARSSAIEPSGGKWRPERDSNPCRRRERAVS